MTLIHIKLYMPPITYPYIAQTIAYVTHAASRKLPRTRSPAGAASGESITSRSTTLELHARL